jgi:hypothetical protein
MKRFLVLCLAFPLGGCFNPLAPITNPISRTNLYQAELVFDGGIKTFNELKGLCAARILPPKCRTYVISGQKLIIKARDADLAAREFVDLHPTFDATTVVQTFIRYAGQFDATVTNLNALR